MFEFTRLKTAENIKGKMLWYVPTSGRCDFGSTDSEDHITVKLHSTGEFKQCQLSDIGVLSNKDLERHFMAIDKADEMIIRLGMMVNKGFEYTYSNDGAVAEWDRILVKKEMALWSHIIKMHDIVSNLSNMYWSFNTNEWMESIRFIYSEGGLLLECEYYDLQYLMGHVSKIITHRSNRYPKPTGFRKATDEDFKNEKSLYASFFDDCVPIKLEGSVLSVNMNNTVTIQFTCCYSPEGIHRINYDRNFLFVKV